jgi:glycosyltransferase involved in cell wall biosynthesis
MVNAGFKANFSIIPNVVNTNVFNFQNDKPATKFFTFLHISTLDDSIKNVSGIIDAFEKLEQPNLILKIVGDGPIDWILNRVKTLKSSNTIIVNKEMKHQDVATEMQLADVFVLFSNIENLPLVLIESISCGTPFISSNVGGVAELHNNELGVLVEAGNVEELTIEMNNIIKNLNKYNPQKIRQFAIDQYSDEVVGKKFNDLYIQLC